MGVGYLKSDIKKKQQVRQKETYQKLKKIPKLQLFYIFAAISIIFGTITVINLIGYSGIRKQNEVLREEYERMLKVNASLEPIRWENRDARRIFRDYESLNNVFEQIFTFRTLDDMMSARDIATKFGLSNASLQMLFDPNELLTRDMFGESGLASQIDCYYKTSEIYLIEITESRYRYLCRIYLDVLSDSNIELVMILDIDEDGNVLQDLCYISSLPSHRAY